MEQRKLPKILLVVLMAVMSARPAQAQVSDVIGGRVLPSVIIAAPLSYGVLSLLFEDPRTAKKRFLIGVLCVCPIGMYLSIESFGPLALRKSSLDIPVMVLLSCAMFLVPLLSCILLEKLSLLQSILRISLSIPAAGAGLVLMLLLADIVVPYSMKASFYRLPESCSEILFGAGAGIFPGVVFWLTRKRSLDASPKGVKSE